MTYKVECSNAFYGSFFIVNKSFQKLKNFLWFFCFYYFNNIENIFELG